ncbi:MAG: transposase, partial [Cyclobacteriaceae bacterium]
IAMHRDSTTTNTNNTFGPQSKNLASIIRGFKSAVTTRARKMGNPHFAWQSRYHDHIIRHGVSFRRISQYIRNNPLQWKEDRFWGNPNR